MTLTYIGETPGRELMKSNCFPLGIVLFSSTLQLEAGWVFNLIWKMLLLEFLTHTSKFKVIVSQYIGNAIHNLRP